MSRSGTDGADKLRALSKSLRKQSDGKERAKALRRELRAPAKQIQTEVRAAIRRIPSKSQSARLGRRSLRVELARSVTVQIRTSGKRAGVWIFMSPRKMPDGKKSLAAYFEATPHYTRLRHPTFGNRKAMVTQRPHPYFSRIVASAQRMATRAGDAVVAQTAKNLERP